MTLRILVSLVVLLILVACNPASVDNSQTVEIVITEEPIPTNQYCETIYSSTFRTIQRCEYEGQICYVANGPDSIDIDCIDD